jgi:nitroreductase/NAD-dependent dihydropyrimidine dehydrogenase PreA subunit
MNIDRSITARIDPESCIGCGQCLRVCPSQVFSMHAGKARVTGSESINCGHCEAVCPTGAIAVAALDQDSHAFSGFNLSDAWIPPGRFDTAALVSLMASRRSCRNYRPDPVPRQMITDIIRAGITAPSGSNCQPWRFSVLTDRLSVIRLGEAVADYFSRLNRLAARAWLRHPLKWLGRPELHDYHRNYYDTIREGLEERQRTGVDRLFHGATAAVIVATGPDAACPTEDALLATQNMLLAAHAMGLGTCLVGFAVSVMQRDRRIAARFDIPVEETVRAVIAMGYPDETYQRPAGRKPVPIRFV